MSAVETFINHFSDVWVKSPDSFPDFAPTYSAEEKRVKEQHSDRIQKRLKELQEVKRRGLLKNGDPGAAFFPLFREMMQEIFDFDAAHLEIILADDFRNVSRTFFYDARKFGPELTPENIYQGLRNVWIMNGLQLMMGLPVEITPSVFAYSMIYPYSDNLLDDASLTQAEKEAFSARFNNRLHGGEAEPASHTEHQLFRLVKMIEDQYPRDAYEEVYESLYAIQTGQTRSIGLMNGNGIDDTTVQSICFEKGGASVLADGYLVAGKLTTEQEQALFGYGVYLQLLDDIQDIAEDSRTHTKTLFACRGKSNQPEMAVNRTVHFGRRALEELRCFKNENTDKMLGLMNRSIEAMIIESAGLNPGVYPNSWLSAVEQHSPLSFKYIRERKAKSKSQRFELFKRYFDKMPDAFNSHQSNAGIPTA